MADVIYDFDGTGKKLAIFKPKLPFNLCTFMVLFYDITHIVYN